MNLAELTTLAATSVGAAQRQLPPEIRALARDWRVAVLQFVKSGDWKVGEEKIGRTLGVEWHSLGGGFTWDSDNLQHDIDLAKTAWATAASVLAAGGWSDKIEVCISDNASPDGTPNVIAAFQPPGIVVKKFRQSENVGFSRNLQTVSRMASGVLLRQRRLTIGITSTHRTAASSRSSGKNSGVHHDPGIFRHGQH